MMSCCKIINNLLYCQCGHTKLYVEKQKTNMPTYIKCQICKDSFGLDKNIALSGSVYNVIEKEAKGVEKDINEIVKSLEKQLNAKLINGVFCANN